MLIDWCDAPQGAGKKVEQDMIFLAGISRTGVAKARGYWLRWAAIALIASTAGANGEIHQLQYERLQEALAEHQQIADDGGWPTLPAGPTIEPDSDDPRVATLARRLAASGDLGDDRTEFVYHADGEDFTLYSLGGNGVDDGGIHDRSGDTNDVLFWPRPPKDD